MKSFKSHQEPVPIENINVKGSLLLDLSDNIQFIKDTLGESSDLVIREFNAGEEGKIKVGVFYTDGLVDKNAVQEYIIKILMLDIRKVSLDPSAISGKKIVEVLKEFALPNGEIDEIIDFKNLFNNLLSGDTIILIDGYAMGYHVNTKGWKDRGVQEPSSQSVVRGPKDGFSETLQTNTALLRRRIKDTNLWIETKSIGRRTKTNVAIAYIKDIANDKIVEEVRSRLEQIDIDGILESGNIEELIQDKAYTPFPTIYNAERPDAIAAGLLAGQVAILVDGTPFVLLVPALFFHFMQNPEDFYQRFDISTMIRIIRYLSLLITLLTPSVYIAITTFHQEMLPAPLLISFAAQREGVPLPTFLEALFTEIVFEILREAGIRMPRAIGQAVSFVGALVLGQAAVNANIISPVVVIVVSLTAISSFATPAYNMSASIRILRFAFIFLGTTLGLYGVSIGLIALVLHLCSIRSFGVPYMAPMAPFNRKDQKDIILRFPLGKIMTRHGLISENSIRQNKS